jgi:uncharacterized protein (TIGR00730 family)
MQLRRVCVFCGSSPGRLDAYREAATAFGAELAARGLGLVYGGGNVGLMGVVADAALAGGAEVIGVIPEALVAKELAHRGVSELVVTRSMHERKATMSDRADAFVMLPGGFGTYEEFCEVLTWSQLGLHQKPCGLLDVAGFYGPLLAFFDGAVQAGFVSEAHRGIVLDATEPAALLDRLAAWVPSVTPKWIDRTQT